MIYVNIYCINKNKYYLTKNDACVSCSRIIDNKMQCNNLQQYLVLCNMHINKMFLYWKIFDLSFTLSIQFVWFAFLHMSDRKSVNDWLNI